LLVADPEPGAEAVGEVGWSTALRTVRHDTLRRAM
jgi:hypothetical protein